jgi:hypothetical protein
VRSPQAPFSQDVNFIGSVRFNHLKRREFLRPGQQLDVWNTIAALVVQCLGQRNLKICPFWTGWRRTLSRATLER